MIRLRKYLLLIIVSLSGCLLETPEVILNEIEAVYETPETVDENQEIAEETIETVDETQDTDGQVILEEDDIPRERTQEEIDAAIIEVLKIYAPYILEMEYGIEQAIAVMSTLHNATQYKIDPRQNMYKYDELLTIIFTDPSFGMQCSVYSKTLFDLFIALGYKTRMIQFWYVGPDGPDGHNVNEVMIDGKLYVMDATFNIMFMDDEENYLSCKEAIDRVANGDSLIIIYVGSTNFPLENRYLPYENYLKQTVRALPFGSRRLYELNERIDGEEFLHE